ncbi:MAG: HAD hydrolase-like protein [Terriglobales bacterium]
MNILFDLDGTLTDPGVGIVSCIRYALEKLGREQRSDRALARYIGPPLRESFSEILNTSDKCTIDHAVTMYRERYSTIGLLENEVYAGIPDALLALRERGDTLFVATSKPGIYAQQILEHFGLANYFRAIWGCELDGARSDKGELIAHLLDREKLKREHTVMIGDRSHDAVGARANGIVPVGVLWGYGDEAELISAQCQVLVRATAELPESTVGISDRQ